MTIADLLRQQIEAVEQHIALLKDATDDEAGRTADRIVERSAVRVRSIMDSYQADLAKADATNSAGFYLYSAEERQARRTAALEQREQSLGEIRGQHEKIGQELAALDTAIDDVAQKRKMPLAWATVEEQARADVIRAEVKRQLPDSTAAEIVRQVGVIGRSGDWVRARVWHDELATFLNTAPHHVGAELAALPGELQALSRNPAVEKEAERLQKAHDRLQDRFRALASAFAPVVMSDQAASRSGAYTPL